LVNNLGETKMISEQDKQKILNGAYGVSRNGLKCRFIGNTTNKFFIHMFVYFNNDDLIVDKATVNKDFVNDTYFESPTDIVGLWKDKPEPFNLERALAGEPVKLRDGSKAYVKYVMPEEYKGDYPLNGYCFAKYLSGKPTVEQWTLEGREYALEGDYEADIIEMWKEPEPVSDTITVTLPCSLKEPQDKMWIITADGYTRSSYGKNIQEGNFKRIPYFGTEAHAKAWFDAMQNSRK